jgi:hypothetical protein
MSRSWRTVRARALTPNRKEVLLSERGFPAKDDASRQALESVGSAFLDGFERALEARDASEIGVRLDTIEPAHRGFAYEGAGMSLTVLDGLTPGGGNRVHRFVAGPAAIHSYMVYVGVGWAYAKLPRFRWRAVTPADPLLRWLVLDGFGFYHAYFDTDRYVHGQYADPPLRWPADAPNPIYARRVVDQGIGRASWFVAGADPVAAAALIATFPAARRPDLWSGMGLAATYAGSADQAELETLWESAGEHQPQLAQGAAFAAKARVLAGLSTAHTPVATAVFCGRTPEEAAEVTDRARLDLPEDGALPAYEIWRQRIQKEFGLVRR